MMKRIRKLGLILLVIFLLFLWFASAKNRFTFSQSPPPLATPTIYTYLPIAYKPWPFIKTAPSPYYLQNYANNAGCNWLGIAGEVFDQDRAPVPSGSYRIHIWGSGIDTYQIVGSAPEYGPSGWGQFLFDVPVVRDYSLQLETMAGTVVSPIYPVQTRATCWENLVRFDFVQNS